MESEYNGGYAPYPMEKYKSDIYYVGGPPGKHDSAIRYISSVTNNPQTTYIAQNIKYTVSFSAIDARSEYINFLNEYRQNDLYMNDIILFVNNGPTFKKINTRITNWQSYSTLAPYDIKHDFYNTYITDSLTSYSDPEVILFLKRIIFYTYIKAAGIYYTVKTQI